MKKILGLDLGVSSIGWALVNEAENDNEKSSIIKLGVRVNPLTVDEKTDFEKGKSITTNANRTSKRGARRNLQRYKLRRDFLMKTLKGAHFITDETILSEDGKNSTFQTLHLRAKAASQEISLEELARVFLNINKKRGYRSNRKCKSSEEDGSVIDSISLAKELYEKDYTPGQYVYNELILKDKKSSLSFYRSDLEAEFDRLYTKQAEFYPEQLTSEFKEELKGKNSSQTWAIIAKKFSLEGENRKLKREEKIKDNYRLRAEGLAHKLEPEKLAIALQEVNNDIKKSGGYLGDISDRNKELCMKGLTIGQYLVTQIDKDPNRRLKGQVFYRSDYMDEFDKIWSTQSKYHPELTEGLKHEIRDVIIFYQRPLRSQKGLVSNCEFEPLRKVAPKSSPLYQEFRMWQEINNLTVNGSVLSDEQRSILADELSVKKTLSSADIKKILGLGSNVKLNYKQVDGDKTQSVLYEAYAKIVEESGNGDDEFLKKDAKSVKNVVSDVFKALGAKTDFLNANAEESSSYFALWHLLYSYVSDNSKSGQDSLVRKIEEITALPEEYAKILANITFEPDYGNLSAKAIRRILPFLEDGYQYSDACEKAGYRHSARSLTKEEIESKQYKNHLEALPKNSLRNPVVEKILNQMVNVVNAVVDEYGKPDEVRIELARELKKSAKEREQDTKGIAAATKDNEENKEELEKEFGISSPTRNDIIRYKLYKELASNGYKTLYSNVKVDKARLFTSDYNIEHIIPQARLFDDSFSNKTIELRCVNEEKGNRTAYDYVLEKYGKSGAGNYEAKIEELFKNKSISGSKRRNLLMRESEIPAGFINRDLRDSQYIARKAKEMLEDFVKSVTSTTGSITARLREDWQLIDVMKELNWDKYDKKGLTEYVEGKDHQKKAQIKGWTKRNDHRHHAMDALTIAFTKPSYIQYLNNLNARNCNAPAYDLEAEDKTRVVMAIEAKELHRDRDNKLRFNPPMPLNELRFVAKENLDNVLVSIKSKNKVVTSNINKTKAQGGSINEKQQLTPRGQLHKEPIYGKRNRYETKEENVGSAFNKEEIATVANKRYREALLRRLSEAGGDVKKAFCGANSLDKKPLWIDILHTEKVPQKVKTVSMVPYYTARKAIDEKIKIESVVDAKVKSLLQARLDECNVDDKNKAKVAFSNLDENPIWFNKEKGIKLKKVTLSASVNTVKSLHYKHDKDGFLLSNESGNRISSDFVEYGGNHHIAIYRDDKGHLQENVVTFYEAVSRANLGYPIIDKDFKRDEGWNFLFSMKQNEYFVFPNPETGFDPSEIDLLDERNYSEISKNLFRVQKLSSKYYCFRHHLETSVEDVKELRDVTWKRITAIDKLDGAVKVRVNHIGKIVQVGEY